MGTHERIEIRTSPEVMDQIRRAAETEGRSVSGFLRHYGHLQATRILGAERVAVQTAPVQKIKVVDTSPPAVEETMTGPKPVSKTSWKGELVDLYKDKGGFYRIEAGVKFYFPEGDAAEQEVEENYQ